MADESVDMPWKFLSDSAVLRDDQDKFGVHSAYARVLYHIAKTCDTPFSIALYSSWGTGKTSICNLVQQFSGNDGNTHYVYLDVWKYSNEPLKRWILLETHRSLLGQAAISDYEFGNRSLQSHLEFQESWEDRDKLSVNFTAVRFLGIGVVVSFCAFLAALFFLPHASFSGRILTMVTAFVAAGGLATFLFEAVVKELFKSLSGLVFDRKVRHVTAASAFSSEKFGEIFQDMVRKATSPKGTNGRRIIFVFDNLDRCSEAVAVETIGVIKTYLDEPGCVYIIPCDEVALMRHITKSYTSETDGDGQKNAKEFLNKFFQTTLRLPIAPEFDIETFLDQQLLLARMNDLPADARDVLVLGYLGQTPRQIKRVLNDLTAYRSLAVQAEKEGLVEQGALTSDLSLLTKMSVISVEWPNFLNLLADDPELWADLIDKISTGQRSEIKGISNELTSFLHATRHVSSDADIRPFVYLKRVTYERNIALAAAVQNNLRKGESNEFLELLTAAKTALEQEEIIRIATDLTRRWLEAQPPRDVFLKNAVSVLLKAAGKVAGNRMLELIVSELLDHVLVASKAADLAEVLSLPDLFAFSPVVNAAPKEKCVEKLATLFDSSVPFGKNNPQYWGQFLDHESQLSPALRSKLRESIEDRYASTESEALQLLFEASKRKATTDAELDWVISAPVLSIVATKLTFLGDETDTQRIAVLKNFRYQIDEPAGVAVTNAILATVLGTRTRAFDAQAKTAIGLLHELIPVGLGQHHLDLIAVALIEQVTVQGNYLLKAPWLAPLIIIRDALPASTQTTVDALYLPYLQDAPDPSGLTQFLTAMTPPVCALLLTIPQNIPTMQLQAQRLEARLGTGQAPLFREQILNCFPPSSVIAELAIFDETRSWDLALFPKVIERGRSEGVDADVLRIKFAEFIALFVSGKSSTHISVLDQLLEVAKGGPELLDETVARALSECCIEVLCTNVEKYFSDLRFLATRLSKHNRLWAAREVFAKVLEPRQAQWIQVLQKLGEDLAADEDLSADHALSNDLMAYAFEAARASASEASQIVIALLPYLEPDRARDYIDQAQDRLIALESSGEPISQTEPYLALLRSASSQLNGELPQKLVTFCNRMLGVPKPEEERNIVLGFLRDMGLALVDKSLAERILELVPTDDLLAEAARNAKA